MKGSLDLTSGGDASLEITLAPNAAEISGTLRDAKGAPVPVQVVNLWTLGRGTHNPRNTASDGIFHFKNLAPGDYHLAAWDNVTGNQQTKPAFRKLFDGKAVAVTVHEGSRETADVKLIVE